MNLGGGAGRGGKGRPGRQLSYATKVEFNGNLLVGKAYTAQLGLEPGDEFEIKLGRKQVKLIPWALPKRSEVFAPGVWLMHRRHNTHK
jgi:hypothetical protein